jgi:outer membrane lipoprotein SlyB
MQAIKSTSIATTSLVAVLSLSLFGCGSTSTPRPVSSAGASTVSSAPAVSGYGVVQSVDVINRQDAGIGLGAVAGAVVGGVVGNQVGKGRGNTVATVAGAAGGAYAGHQMQKQARRDDQVYRVTVRMDDGSLQAYTQETFPTVGAGDRVRISGGVIERY